MSIFGEDFKFGSDVEDNEEEEGESEEDTGFNELNDIDELNDIERSEGEVRMNMAPKKEREVRFRRYGTGNYRRNPSYLAAEVHRDVNEADTLKRSKRGYVNGVRPFYETDKLKYKKNDNHDMMAVYLMPVRCYTCAKVFYQEEIENVIKNGLSLQEYVNKNYIRDCCKMRIYSSPFVIWTLEVHKDISETEGKLTNTNPDGPKITISNTGPSTSDYLRRNLFESKIISEEALKTVSIHQQDLNLDLSMILNLQEENLD